MADDLCMMPATELVAAFQHGTLSPVEATEAALARIEAVNGTFNAFVVVDAFKAEVLRHFYGGAADDDDDDDDDEIVEVDDAEFARLLALAEAEDDEDD